MKKVSGKFFGFILAAVLIFSPIVTSAAANESSLLRAIENTKSKISKLQTELAQYEADLKALRDAMQQQALPDATLGKAYSYGAALGSKKYRVLISSGALPPGLLIQTSEQCGAAVCTGGAFNISGTPTKIGTYTFKIKSKDRNGSKVTETTYTLNVLDSSVQPIDLTVSCPAYTFSQNLTMGSTNNDVVALQKLLTAKGHYSGDISGYFGQSTKTALASYQSSKGISPADGYGGVITRAALNSDCSGSAPVVASKLFLQAPPVPLRSQNHRINAIDTVQAPLVLFNLKSEMGDTRLTVVKATAASDTGALPSALYLFNGETMLSAKTVPVDGNVTFDNLSLVIPKDTSVGLTVKGTFEGTVSNGGSATAKVTSAEFQSGTGTSSVSVGAPVVGVPQYFYNSVAQFALASSPTLNAMTNTSTGKTTSIVSSFHINVSAIGGSVTQLNPADVVVKLVGPMGQKYSPSSTSVVTVPNDNIADGAVATVSVTSMWSGSTLPPPGIYGAVIESVRWSAGTSTANQTYGLEDYKTPITVGVIAQKTGLKNQLANAFASIFGIFSN